MRSPSSGVLGGGVIIAVMGRLSVAEAQQLAACRPEGSQGIALLLEVSSWSDEARRRRQANGGTNGSAANGTPGNGTAANGGAADGGTSHEHALAGTCRWPICRRPGSRRHVRQ